MTKSYSIQMILMGAVFVMFVAMGCGDKIDPVQDQTTDGLPAEVTYSEHIQPLLQDNCTSCHATSLQGADRNGAPLGIDLDTYATATGVAASANARIQAGSMPPGGSLPDYQRGLFQRWVDQGLME